MSADEDGVTIYTPLWWQFLSNNEINDNKKRTMKIQD